MIKAIMFDIGGVLIDSPMEKMATHYSGHLGVSKEKFTEVYHIHAPQWQSGKLTEAELWGRICEDLDVALPREEKLWHAGITKAFKQKDEVVELAHQLKKNGYLTAILSNTEVPSWI